MKVDRPEMVLLQAGSFLMGSPHSEAGRSDEGPQHAVLIAEPFALGKYPVTVAQFAEFVQDSGHRAAAICRQWDGVTFHEKPGSFLAPGFDQAGDHPAVCVSWDDAQAYAAWLSVVTGQFYRLPMEAEWEYAARAGTATPYWWGGESTPGRANYKAAGNDAWRPSTVPVTRFGANPWGLAQMHDNVWEWVEDCWRASYDVGDAAGGHQPCERRTLRGGSWLNSPRGIRSARRHAARSDFRRSDIGFRVAASV